LVHARPGQRCDSCGKLPAVGVAVSARPAVCAQSP
jgi:hypothetical protein